jgi:uncharacterized protein
MRTLLIFCFATVVSFSSCGQKKEEKEASSHKIVLPEKPLGWVSDFEKLFTASEINYLDSIIEVNERQTTNQLAVVTLALDSSYINNIESFDQISLRLFNQWSVGIKDKNNGIGILISTPLKFVRIEVGLGLESKLTDEEAKIIIDNFIIPEFKQGHYFNGILNALQEIFKETK